MKARTDSTAPSVPSALSSAPTLLTWKQTARCSAAALLLLSAGCASGPYAARVTDGALPSLQGQGGVVEETVPAEPEWVEEERGAPARRPEVFVPARPAPLDPAFDPFRLGGLTHDLFRGRHPVTRGEGGVKVRTDILRTDRPGGGHDLDAHIALEYGVTDRLTLGAELGPHPAIRSFEQITGTSATDVGLSAMYGVVQEVDLALALRLDVLYSDDRIEWRPAVIGGKRMSEELEVYGGVGAALADERGRTERLTYDFAVARRISRVIVGALELDGAVGRGSFHEMYLTPGVIFNARRRLQARLGAPFGLTSESVDYQILVGLSVLF